MTLIIEFCELEISIHVRLLGKQLHFTGVCASDADNTFTVDQSIIDVLAPELYMVDDKSYRFEMSWLHQPVDISIGRTGNAKWLYVIGGRRVVIGKIMVNELAKTYTVYGSFRKSAVAEEEWFAEKQTIPDAVIERINQVVQ